MTLAACSVGPLGETTGCACAEEFFAYADIERWEAGAAWNEVEDMADLERYYRAKGWHQRADELFKRRLQAHDRTAITEREHLASLERAAARSQVDAIEELSGYYRTVGRVDESRRMEARLVELGEVDALGDAASELFNEATALPDTSPEKLKKLRAAGAHYRRVDQQVSFMDATTLRGAGLSHLLRQGEHAVDMQTLVEREISRLER